MDMTKFPNGDDPGFVAICEKLHLWAVNVDANKMHCAKSTLSQQPGCASQYGDNNCQYNLYGKGTQRIALGHYYEANGHQKFSVIPRM